MQISKLEHNPMTWDDPKLYFGSIRYSGYSGTCDVWHAVVDFDYLPGHVREFDLELDAANFGEPSLEAERFLNTQVRRKFGKYHEDVRWEVLEVGGYVLDCRGHFVNLEAAAQLVPGDIQERINNEGISSDQEWFELAAKLMHDRGWDFPPYDGGEW